MPSFIHLLRVPASVPDRGPDAALNPLRDAAISATVAAVLEPTLPAPQVSGASVVIKINTFMAHAPATTDPRVAAGAVDYCLAAGAKSVTISEDVSISSCIGRGTDIHRAFHELRYDELVASYGSARVRLVPLRAEGTAVVPLPHGVAMRSVEYPLLPLQADVLINLPILKYHRQANLTGAVKNTWSLAPHPVRVANHCTTLPDALLDVHFARKPDVTLVDALAPLEYDHSFGQTVPLRCVFAGTDSIAVDTVGAQLMGFSPDWIDTNRLGSARGLGTADPNQITTLGDTLSDVFQRRFAVFPMDTRDFPPLQLIWHLGRSTGPGCLAYLCTGLESIAKDADLASSLGPVHVFVGMDPHVPDDVSGLCLVVGHCAVASEAYRTLANRKYLAHDLASLITVPGCPPMALRSQAVPLLRQAIASR